MNLKKIFGVITILAPTFAMVSCGKNFSPTAKAENYKDDYLAGCVWYTGSAEMQAMAITEFNQAKVMFDKLKAQSGFETDKVDKTTGVVSNTSNDKSVPVVFMDIDETIINNVAYQNYNIIHNKNYSPDSFGKWVKSAQGREIPGAVSFINYVWDHGGVVMYNSDRLDFPWRDATRQNLIKLGINKKYLPDWTFWMQGINPSTDKPWANQKLAESKMVKTKKETRMDSMNKKDTYDLSGMPETQTSSRNAVSLKTIMRIGDNIDDFNDLATRGKLNSERREVVKDHIGKNFGTTNSLGEIYDPNGSPKKWIDESWNEGYVLMGGNCTYGGWEPGIDSDWWGKTAKEKREAMIQKGLKAYPIWDGTDSWDGN